MAMAQPARPLERVDPRLDQGLRVSDSALQRIRGQLTQRAAFSCPQSAVFADVVAIDHPMVFNRLGAQNVNWAMYALRHDLIHRSNSQVLDYSTQGQALFARVVANNRSRDIALRPDLRPRPLVVRVAAGGYLHVRLTNLLEVTPVPPETGPGNPFNSFPDPLPGVDHPMEHAVKDAVGTDPSKTLYRIDDQVDSRVVGFHPQGLELVGSIDSDSSNTGANADSLARPGQTRDYCFHAPHEGAYLVGNDGAVFGGEGSAGNSGVGLFAAVTVQPLNARFYRAQLTEEELRLATVGATPSGQPILNYEATYPNDCASAGVWCREGKAGLPILNMLQGQRLVHGEVNAIVVGPEKDGSFPARTYPLEGQGKRNPALPNRLEPFREFVSVFHDENAATQAFPYFFEHPELSHTLHGVRDGFMINYGSGGVGAEIIANRLKSGPMQDCLDCAYEEFFLSSFAVGDAATLVDNPANLVISQCQPEYLTDRRYAAQRAKYCVQPKEQRATQAYYPHDPANVHHSYIGDFVKFRNLHAGKEQHIFHLHNHQWLFNPNDDNANYIDAQGLGPGSGYTYEIAYGGSGNRNKTVGDAIFHCHFYPHFAQGMWYMWRNHDVFEAGTRLQVSQTRSGFHETPFGLQNGRPASQSRALPDGEIVAGTPIPAVVPLPGKGMAVMPAAVQVEPRIVDGVQYGSVARVQQRDRNPGYPFWVAGAETTMGSRPTTPPLDMSSIPGVVAGHDGGIPRHALAGYSAGGVTDAKLDRMTAEKHIKLAKPVYYPEAGTDLEQVAMKFHAVREHPTHAVDMAGTVSASRFITNGAPSVPGAPYNEPCIDDQGSLLKRGGDGRFFGGSNGAWITATAALPGGIEFGADSPRVYRGANLQLDVVFNKVGYHYPQQRILTLWEDVSSLLDKTRPPEPLVLRMNTFDCAMYAHTNLVPKDFYADDYQITTPTDVIGQHIHLPKWDLTSADGSANGWNYEDGTFSPGAVRERIHAVNAWNEAQRAAGRPDVVNPYDGTQAPLVPSSHPYFGTLTGHQYADCEARWRALGGDFEKFEHSYGFPGACDWLGARTTLQRWFSDPLVNAQGVHRGLGITFTHDHLGPSTHQQLGLYATMLTEPPGALWRHNETGKVLYDAATRMDGGPTSWQAVITDKGGKPLDSDGDGRDDAHREFFLQFGDFQHAYQKGYFYGVTSKGVPSTIDASALPTANSFRQAIHPSVRKPASPVLPDIVAYEPRCPGGETGLPGAVYVPGTAPPRPCPEAISADDVGMMVVNYRNEPLGLRVYNPSATAADGKSGAQADSYRGDLAFALQTRTDRAISVLNGIGGEDPSLAGSSPHYPADINARRLAGDPYTPILRAYSGDLVRVKIQAGAHEHEHNASINGMAWMQGGSGFGQAPHSGWRNSQNAGLSEQFTFSARITDYESATHLNDRMYTIDSSQDGLWSGVWGVLRSHNRRDVRSDRLVALPSQLRPALLAPQQGRGLFNDCPVNAPVRRYHVAAVLANTALGNALGVTIPAGLAGSRLNPRGGTLVYNPRATEITLQTTDEKGVITTQHYGSGPLHDPSAILFVRNEDLDAKGMLRPDRPVEPLVLRASAGECLQVVLHNRLPRARAGMPDLEGYTSMSGTVRRSAGSGSSSMQSFNNNLVHASNRVGLHPQLVHYDVQSYDGNNVGTNKISTISPNWSKVYQWYAGVIDTLPSAGLCPIYAGDKAPFLDLLSQFAREPNLRPLTELMTAAAFEDVVLSALEPGYALEGSANERSRALASDLLRQAPVQACLESVPDGKPLAGEALRAYAAPPALRDPKEGADAQLDEAALLDGDAYLYRERLADTRGKCVADPALRQVVLERLLQEKTREEADVLTARITASFRYEVEGVDSAANDPSGARRAYAWRELRYPDLTLDSTELVALSAKACRYVGVEFGGSNLTPPDRIKQGQKAAVGALVIEPKGARWREYSDDRMRNRQDPASASFPQTRSRATADVSYRIVDVAGATQNRSFRDLALVHQKGLNLRYADGKAVQNIAAERVDANEDPLRTAPEDAHDSGHMAINYGSEPMWFRFGIAPDAPFGGDGLGGISEAWQAFDNQCCGNGGTATTAQANVGEPFVPVLLAYAGEETRLRSVMPTGVGRASVVELHGHSWPRDPYLAERVTAAGFPQGGKPADWGVPSQCIGDNPIQMAMGGQESVTPLSHFDIVLPKAGGQAGVTGDYLWRDHGGFGITNGLWAIVRVQAAAATYPAAPLRRDCR